MMSTLLGTACVLKAGRRLTRLGLSGGCQGCTNGRNFMSRCPLNAAAGTVFPAPISQRCIFTEARKSSVLFKCVHKINIPCRCYRTEQMANYRSQQFAKRFYAIGYLSAFVGGAVVYLYIRFFERDQLMGLNREVKRSGTGFQMHVDPNMYGNEARLFLMKGFWLPEYMFTSGNFTKVEKFTFSEDDIVVASFPKSGSTWVQEVVYLLNHNLDEKKARKQNMEDRFPQLEYTYPGIVALEAEKPPRLLKTHLPYDLLPTSIQNESKTKVIYIMRNPKDVCVSSYFYSRMHLFLNYQSDLAQYCRSFMTGRVSFGPWWGHVKSYWEHRDDPNLLVVSYEDMVQDPSTVIRTIAAFLGKDLTPKQVKRMAKYCSFDEMKKNPASNYSWWDKLGIRQSGESEFLRNGKVGDWMEHLTSEQSAFIDKICQMYLKPAGIEPQFQTGDKKAVELTSKKQSEPTGQK